MPLINLKLKSCAISTQLVESPLFKGLARLATVNLIMFRSLTPSSVCVFATGGSEALAAYTLNRVL